VRFQSKIDLICCKLHKPLDLDFGVFNNVSLMIFLKAETFARGNVRFAYKSYIMV